MRSTPRHARRMVVSSCPCTRRTLHWNSLHLEPVARHVLSLATRGCVAPMARTSHADRLRHLGRHLARTAQAPTCTMYSTCTPSSCAAVNYSPPEPRSIDDLRTPCLVLQLGVAKRNIDRMQARADKLGCVVRPHVKTHKTLELGALQTQGTRRRIAVSTLAEAEFFAAGGFDDILYAVPITPDKLPEAAALTVALESFHILVDNTQQLEAIFSQPAPSALKPWSVWLMVDCGYHRDGVDPTDLGSVEIARRLCESSTTTFAGIYTHGGHSYDADGSGGPVRPDAVVEAGEAERDVTVEFKRLLEKHGIHCPTVGVGSTPTCSAPPAHLDGVHEMHPGNYIFNDTTQSMLGSCTVSDIAVKVLTRVIGHYPTQNMLLIDLGWTGCSAQGAEFGYGVLAGHPELKVVQLKQEAGEVEPSDHAPLDFDRYPIGSILELLPYHSCAAVKMHDRMHVLDEDGRTVLGNYQICRGW